jgi:hypothetical protein
VIRVDRLHRAFAAAGVAIDARVRIDEEHAFAFVKAVARADDDAIAVFAAETRLGHNVSHWISLFCMGSRDAAGNSAFPLLMPISRHKRPKICFRPSDPQ